MHAMQIEVLGSIPSSYFFFAKISELLIGGDIMKDISNDIIDLLDAIQLYHHISVSAALIGIDDYVKKADDEMIDILNLLRSLFKESFD